MFCDVFDLLYFQNVVAFWPTIGGFPFSVSVIICNVISKKTFVFEERFGIFKSNLLYINGTVNLVYAEAALLSILVKYVYYVD